MDKNIKFTQEDVRVDSLSFLDFEVHIEENRSLNTEVCRKPTCTDQYWLADTVSTKTEGTENEQRHIRGALKTCGYPNWIIVKTSERSWTDRGEETEKHYNIVISYVGGISEKLRRIFNKLSHPGSLQTYLHTEAETCPSLGQSTLV